MSIDNTKLVRCGNVYEFVGEFTFKDALKRADKIGNWLAICSDEGNEFELIYAELYIPDLPPYFKELLYSEKMVNQKIRMANSGVVTFVIFKEDAK